MAKLGTNNRPAIVRVRPLARAEEIIALCDKYGWQVIAGIEPGQPENVEDVRKLVNRHLPLKVAWEIRRTLFQQKEMKE